MRQRPIYHSHVCRQPQKGSAFTFIYKIILLKTAAASILTAAASLCETKIVMRKQKGSAFTIKARLKPIKRVAILN